MNKYFSLLVICSAATLYGQNPPAHSAGAAPAAPMWHQDENQNSQDPKTFEDKVIQANKAYQTLSHDEQMVCDLMYKNWVIQCARELRDREMQDLIPTEINPDENLATVDQSFKEIWSKANLPKKRVKELGRISYFKWCGLWKAKADSVGKKCVCWSLDLAD